MFSTLTEVFLTLTEVYPYFSLRCKANAKVKLAKKEHGPHSSTLVVICIVLLLIVLFYVLFVCKCVLYYCHRVATQLQLTNMSYQPACRIPSIQHSSLGGFGKKIQYLTKALTHSTCIYAQCRLT